jgi:hypothetical protein
MAHIGGRENLLTEDGRNEIECHVQHYLWKYPDGKCWCTACGQEVGPVAGWHNSEVSCPVCKQAAMLKHEARGHKKLFDEFDHRYWRRSIIDPETVVLTITQVWRDSRGDRPETAHLFVKPTAIYLYKLGRPTTVYKNHYWYAEDGGTWSLQSDVRPENTYGGRLVPAVEDRGRMRLALRGTGLGRVYEAVHDMPYRSTDIVELANCAARPWLEYLAKCGQEGLAYELMTCRHISRPLIPRPRAANPRELLGLTEGQWYEVRRDHIDLTGMMLETLRAMRRMGYSAVKIAEVREMCKYGYAACRVSPEKYDAESIDALTRGLPDRLRRRVLRAAVRDGTHFPGLRRDYYKALRVCGEDMADTALLLTKDLKAMHDRYTARAADIIEARKRERLKEIERNFQGYLDGLRAKYSFTACGLTLRPYETAQEIMEEGRALKICIGMYAERYMQGDTVICCLRREDAPDAPFHAVEFSATTGQMVQDRGLRNTPTHKEPPETKKQIEQFWKAFGEKNKREARAV